MDEFESIAEEYDNNYEELDKEMPGDNEGLEFVETLTITKIN